MAAPKIILRLYRPSDFETLYEIDEICFPRGIAYQRDEFKTYLSSVGAYCVLAEVLGDIAGFVLTERSGKRGHIVTLEVLEKYRRQHIGTLLLRAAEQEAALQGVTRMYLETATENKAAIALWKKHGYRESGILKDYYGNGFDGFEMEKSVATVLKKAGS